MKKIAGLLLAFVLCLSLSVGAFAVETQVDNNLVADIVDGIGELVEAESEGNNEAMKKAVEQLYSALQTAQQSGDVSAVIDNAVKYAMDENNDTSVIFTNRGALNSVIGKFLTDGSYAPDKIVKELKSSSALGTLVSIYTGANEPTTANAADEDAEAPVVNEFQPEVENPDTSDSFTGVVVAISTLAVSTVAAVALSKKKED